MNRPGGEVRAEGREIGRVKRGGEKGGRRKIVVRGRRCIGARGGGESD